MDWDMRASWVVQGHGDSLVGLGTEDGFLRGHNGTSPPSHTTTIIVREHGGGVKYKYTVGHQNRWHVKFYRKSKDMFSCQAESVFERKINGGWRFQCQWVS